MNLQILMKVLNELWDGIVNAITSSKLREGDAYACNTGDFVGEFFIYMEDSDVDHIFLSLPKMEERKVPFDKFEFAVKERFIEKVENLPKDVYLVCRDQHIKNQNSV